MRGKKTYDVAIVGAGPAGSTCALALKDSGLSVILFDKAQFPRDKVCGDAIPARCAHVLRDLNPAYLQKLESFPQKTSIQACRIYAPNRHHFTYEFHVPGYCSPRLDFDAFLLDLALDEHPVDFEAETEIKKAVRLDGQWELEDRKGRKWEAQSLVLCDGANSRLARQLTGRKIDPAHHCAAVRAYYKDVRDMDPHRMEIHFLDEYLPGYFWMFPLPNGVVNVGFGMLSHQIQRQKINLRAALPAILTSPELADRFQDSVALTEPIGFGLPMGSRKVPLSGEGLLLCGDAAALIEPATGEGIGNAMLSGQLAANTLVQHHGKASNAFLAYDEAVYNRLWRDLRNKYYAQRFLGDRKSLMNWLVKNAGRKGPLRWLMRKVF